MSTVAASVILHPKVGQVLALLATTVGRDKVGTLAATYRGGAKHEAQTYRLIQYLARLISWSLLRRGSIDAAARWDGLKLGLAGGRKMLRIFKPIEHLQSAMNLAQRPITNLNGPGQLAQVTQLGRQLAYAGFLGTDMLVWLNSVRFLRYDKDRLAKLSRLSNKLWISGIFLSLISTTSSLIKLRSDSRRFALSAQIARREGEKRPEDEAERRERGRALLSQRQTILSQLIMDSCDVWIPANNLGYSNLNEGVIGVLGATTSYMALQTQWLKHRAAKKL
ncbi:hypothetical protein P7C73_g2258, partial [Tremellales sp. Uapishka_1]